MAKNTIFFVRKYLETRPMFLAIIRAQEAMLFQKYKKQIKGRVLDLGCGDGFFAETVFGKNKIDVGLDLFESRAKIADREKIYKKVVYYDGRSIPCPDRHFSTVISNCVLEHIPNLDRVLSEVRRVLKPGGYFITSVMTDQWENYLVGQKLIGKPYLKFMRKTQEHYNLLSKREWIQKFRKAGFGKMEITDYMGKQQSGFTDVFHYLSFPALISQKVTGKWVIWPKWYRYVFVDELIAGLLRKKVNEDGAALFFSCKN